MFLGMGISHYVPGMIPFIFEPADRYNINTYRNRFDSDDVTASAWLESERTLRERSRPGRTRI